MSASKLVKPSLDYKESYLEAIKEFQDEGRYKFLNLKELDKNFEQFVEDLKENRRHLHLPFEDWVEPVPETVLWMVKEKEFIGTFNIRHRLNWHLEKWGGHINFVIRPSMRGKGFGKKILRKGMQCACFLGVDKVLITVDPDNESAVNTVESVGAEYQDDTQATEKFPSRKRYWLDCS
ncbi:MAG: GNAT family N-acetyltransferase [Pseudomonadota bacterium]